MNWRTGFVVFALFVPSTFASAKHLSCYFGQPTPWRVEAMNAKIVVYGYFDNAQRDPNGEGGTTDLFITSTIKNDPLLGGKQKLQVPKFVPFNDPDQPPRMLVFGDEFKGELDFYRGIECTPAVVNYLKGLLAIDPKDRAKQLSYCFDYLEHADAEIAADAFREFQSMTTAELIRLPKKLSPAKLRQLLQSDKTAAYKLNTYALLLGHCGNAKDVALLREVTNRLIKSESNLLMDGLLTARVLLQPEPEWTEFCKLTANRDTPFLIRYAGLKSARVFFTEIPNIVPQKKIIALYEDLLAHDDLADFIIQDLRKWKQWDLTPRVLSYWGKESHKAPVIRRAIVHYALQCPDPQAKKLIADLRLTDPQYVADADERMQLEEELHNLPAPAPKKE